MKLSIVTPSFRNSEWLKLCIASVADQSGVEVEHIVQDAKSDDGTLDWLPSDRRVKAYIEKDSGMYDAVNRGWKRAQGDILAYLNCDEQYLPGALASVAEYFSRHPKTDVLLADAVVVDNDGRFIVCRKSLVPWRHFVWVQCPTLTCSIFMHRRLLDQHQMFFDTQWRDLGDIFWMIEAVKRRLNMAVMRRYTSAFTDTGANMNLKPNALMERRRKWELTPLWIRRLQRILFNMHRVRMLCRGVYSERPFSYSIFTHQSPLRRVEFSVAKPTGIWWARHGIEEAAIADKPAGPAHPVGG